MDDGASKHVALRAERVKTPSFRISHCVMDLAARDFASVDLRGLGRALRAHAKARGTTVSAVIRQAIATQLETHAPGLDDHAVTDGEENEIVKLMHGLSQSDERIVLSVTHSLRHLALYDSVLVLYQGHVAYHGAPDTLFATRVAPLGMRVMRMRASFISPPVCASRSLRILTARGS